ncbi:MAG: hypothetical protein ACOYYS_03030 [Chloroflexota bacterium]
MLKDIQVILVEDDPYAREFMSMLLRRDWRTRVVGEYGSDCAIELHHALRRPAAHVDVLLVDTEVPHDEQWPMKVAQITRSLPQPPVILYTCTQPTRHTLEHVLATGRGYLVKGEILYSLASAISAAVDGHFVLTPGTQMISGCVDLPADTVVLDGTLPVADFTPREKDLTRLGVLFSLGQRDIADDLVISTDFVAEITSQIYEKLGVRAVLSGERALEDVFSDEKLSARCRVILQQAGISPNGKNVRKTPWMSTLAFHLLTIPGMERLDNRSQSE